MAKETRLRGKICYTNLTRRRKEGESPETEFVSFIISKVPSLGSQVYVHRSDIVEGDYEDFRDGVEVEFTPERVFDEKFQAAIDSGNRIRRYAGKNVKLASANTGTTESSSKEQVESIAPARLPKKGSQVKKSENEIEYTIILDAQGPNRFFIIGRINDKPAELTYAVSAVSVNAGTAKFILLGREEAFEFDKYHHGLKAEDGALDFEVEYDLGSLDLAVRCLESNTEKYLTLWK